MLKQCFISVTTLHHTSMSYYVAIGLMKEFQMHAYIKYELVNVISLLTLFNDFLSVNMTLYEQFIVTNGTTFRRLFNMQQ
jgi:hypothetical protein